MVSCKGASSSKRDRAAGYERRQRRKINEKLREVKELIPNYNKVDTTSMLDEATEYTEKLQLEAQVDKASMLDDAIEYMKRLQLEVQILSMRTGDMLLMMLPPHMQQIQAAYVPLFLPMGLGMGMRFGMNDVAQVPVEQGTKASMLEEAIKYMKRLQLEVQVDKASMLDDAIEYIKRLQLEVQMLSMRTGYMPLMMLPPHMQQIQAAYVPPFSPMGLRMGMGLKMGVGMDAVAQVPVEQGEAIEYTKKLQLQAQVDKASML